MITILISEDEIRAKEALARMFAQEGYELSESCLTGNIIRVVKKGCIRDLAFIGDTAIEIQDSFLSGRGALYKSVVEEIEKPLIEHTLESTQGNQIKAAKVLGLNRKTLRTKIRKLGINVRKWKII